MVQIKQLPREGKQARGSIYIAIGGRGSGLNQIIKRGYKRVEEGAAGRWSLVKKIKELNFKHLPPVRIIYRSD